MNTKVKRVNTLIAKKRPMRVKSEPQGEITGEKPKRGRKPNVDKTFTLDERLTHLYEIMEENFDLFLKGKKVVVGKCIVQWKQNKFTIVLKKGKKLLWEKMSDDSG
jgi:hypothetical protein